MFKENTHQIINTLENKKPFKQSIFVKKKQTNKKKTKKKQNNNNKQTNKNENRLRDKKVIELWKLWHYGSRHLCDLVMSKPPN